MRFAAHIITAYPHMFPGPLGESLSGRALQDGLWQLQTHDLRDFGHGKHQNIDDTPAGVSSIFWCLPCPKSRKSCV